MKVLRNNKGMFAGAFVCALLVFAPIHYGVTTGKNIFKAKPKTVDTMENPAQCVDCNLGKL